MMDIIICLMLVILAFVTGYTINNKTALDSEQRSLELAKNCKTLETEKTLVTNMVEKQEERLIMKDEYCKEILRALENNNYGNIDVMKRKIKELAETAIQH